jgi:hypothetical protein
MTNGDRKFEAEFPGKTALEVFPMDGTEKSCARCSLEFKTLLHPFCQHRYCPARELSQQSNESASQ